MKPTEWAKALIEIRKGNKAVCPSCKKADIEATYVPYEDEVNEGMVVLTCPRCEEHIHFSHQKPL